MTMSEYWIGADTNYQSVWTAYEEGLAYIEKFRSMRVHMLTIELTEFNASLPLFNHEAVYKTIKGYFHDFKRACLSKEEYDATGPLFLYSVHRGSGIWKFLGEARATLAFAITLASGKVLGQELDNIDKQLHILQKYFPDVVNPKDIERFMSADTPKDLRYAVRKLISQGIQNVSVSQQPFTGKIKQTEKSAVNITQIILYGDLDMSENTGRDKIVANNKGTAIGGNAKVTKSRFNQVLSEYSDKDKLFQELAQELNDLRAKMRSHVSEAEHDIAIGQLAEAEIAAKSGNGVAVLQHLRNAGKWAFEFATQVGATLVAEIIKGKLSL